MQFLKPDACSLKPLSPRYTCDRGLYLLFRVLQVDQLSCEVLLVGREVEVTVAAKVEEDGLLLSGFLGFERQIYGGFDRMRNLGRRHYTLRPGERDPGLDESLVRQRRDYGGVAVVTQPPRMDAARDERVP